MLFLFFSIKISLINQKIVLCHELGHALLHSEKSELFAKEHFLHYSSKLENEANEFAVWLLLKQYKVLTEEMIEACDLKREFKKEIIRVLYRI